MAEFNKGYYRRQGRIEGAYEERQRIIKLLEPLGCPENGVEHDCQNGLGYTTAADIIALIKGETNEASRY